MIIPRFKTEWVNVDNEGYPCYGKSHWIGEAKSFEWLWFGFTYYIGEIKPVGRDLYNKNIKFFADNIRHETESALSINSKSKNDIENKYSKINLVNNQEEENEDQ